MSHVVADGKSNWLEGLILVCKFLPLHFVLGGELISHLERPLRCYCCFILVLPWYASSSYSDHTTFIIFVGSTLTESIGRCLTIT